MKEQQRLFVGGLNYSTTPAELRDFVVGMGFQLVDSHIVRDHITGKSKGFGFITLADGQDPGMAISVLNGKDLSDRTLTVNKALPKKGLA